MKTLILAAGALALSTAAYADEIVTKQSEAGVHSAPVAGATPQSREYPAPDTTMLEKHDKTTVTHEPSTVIEDRGSAGSVEVETRSR